MKPKSQIKKEIYAKLKVSMDPKNMAASSKRITNQDISKWLDALTDASPIAESDLDDRMAWEVCVLTNRLCELLNDADGSVLIELRKRIIGG